VGGGAPFDYYLPCAHGKTQNRDLTALFASANMSWIKERGEDRIRLHVIANPDPLTYKVRLWSACRAAYGRADAARLMPDSYVFADATDMQALRERHTPGTSYMLKKEKHRQQGLSLVDDLTAVLANADAYLTAQVYQRAPYTIAGHKTSFRMYTAAMCVRATGEGEGPMRVLGYGSDFGFVYYAPAPHTPDCADADCAITSGYVPRSFYEGKPLSLRELRTHVAAERGEEAANGLFARMRAKFSLALHAAASRGFLCTDDHIPPLARGAIRFQHFGCDFQASSSSLDPLLFECNKGPDYAGKDERDISVKEGFATALASLAGFRGKLDTSAAGARALGLHKVYDSVDFDVEAVWGGWGWWRW
jgi:hypothetical protein